MTDIEAKALALLNEIKVERGKLVYYDVINRNHDVVHEALCRAIEQHEAFKQEVSDAVEEAFGDDGVHPSIEEPLVRFIIPKPKPDPLVEAWIEATGNTVGMEPLNAALEARGLEIREKGQ